MKSDDSATDLTLDAMGDKPIRKAIRRLRWFKSSFEAEANAVSLKTDITLEVDSRKLTKCFVDWIETFEKVRPNHGKNRAEFIGYSSGSMLRQLINHNPITVVALPKKFDKDDPAYFWPEGFVYVQYCLKIRQAVVEQELDGVLMPSSAIDDMRTWWSFRENVNELSNYAIPFLDLFAGKKPNWENPEIFDGGRVEPQVSKPTNGDLLKSG